MSEPIATVIRFRLVDAPATTAVMVIAGTRQFDLARQRGRRY